MRDQAGAAADDGGGGADQAGDRHQVDVAGAAPSPGLAAAGEGGDAEDALAVADGGDRARSRVRSRPSAASRSRVASWVSSTPGRPSAASDEVGRARRLLVAVEPRLRLERARQRGGELAGDGREPAAGLLDQLRSDREVSGSSSNSSREGGEPVGALASEGDGELLTLVQPVGQGAAAARGWSWSWVSVVGGS